MSSNGKFFALLAICAGNSPVPVNSPHKGQWCGAFMFSLICVRINAWINNHEAGDLRRYPAHYDITLMIILLLQLWQNEISWECTVMYLVFLTLKYICVLSMSCNVVRSWWVLIPYWLMDMNKQFTWTTIDYRVKVSQIWRQRCGKYWGNGEVSKYWPTLQRQVHFDCFFGESLWVKIL